MATHSNVARPSGPEKLQVISNTPGTCWTPGFEGDADAVLAIADGLIRELGWLD